jgi:hypothetical protein
MAHRTPPNARRGGTGFGEATFTVPYNHAPAHARAFIEDLKDAVPSRYRTYDPDFKEWRVWGGFEDLATALLLEHFPDAQVPRQFHTNARAQIRQSGSHHFQTLHLLPSAPPELIDAAYRCLAKKAHPDVGGDAATMRRLTEARDALSRRLST